MCHKAICTFLRRLRAARAVILAGNIYRTRASGSCTNRRGEANVCHTWHSADGVDQRPGPQRQAGCESEERRPQVVRRRHRAKHSGFQEKGRRPPDCGFAGRRKYETQASFLPSPTQWFQQVAGSNSEGWGSVVVAAFGDHLSAALPSSDPGQIEESIQRTANVWLGRKTALFDAIGALCPSKFPEGRKTLVIVSDADDTASKSSLADAVQTIKLTRTQYFFLQRAPRARRSPSPSPMMATDP